jgi:DNA-binding response OmpR family regulator
MKLLIAEDDPISRRVLEATLTKWGYEVVVTSDGVQAWEALQQEDAPRLAILDWMMPQLDGLQLCERARVNPATQSLYIILLTARGGKEDIAAGLEAGASDYVTKPFDAQELRARVRVGFRMIDLQQALADRVQELEAALAQVYELQGILPICSYCKNIRTGEQYWEQVEAYISQYSSARFSHSICPDCYEKVVKPEMEQLRRMQGKGS